ncbi:hypothetical protein STRATTON_152 [Erwinia phage vB_EamM_Stratton]|uniref:Uncharacterized protein n=2 Tax=Erskinevirus EaH2 TaxID=2169883 RepID=A0A1B2IH31_9CAUD|nr:hypothetical protein G173_gp055 [Erwinia phage phiEaH2]AFQ96600.1 hypothetical protein [Erwinia phage phiEaH2]ANZ50577.1 hypothetical protein STRATTON_152 [Erwinia phage vB_EamM_Stratton]
MTIVTTGVLNARLAETVAVIKETDALYNDHRDGEKYLSYADIKYFGVAYHPEFGLCLVAAHSPVQSLNRITVRDGKAYITTWDVGGTLRADWHKDDMEAALNALMSAKYSNLVAIFKA